MENDNIQIPPNWDEYFMRMVYLIATKSKDPRTKIGAVIVKDKRIISTGYNGFPIGVKDLPERYNDREIKYKYIVHAEHNSILSCARFGISCLGSTLYTNGFPCNSCILSIIQSGIHEIVTHSLWEMNHLPKWVESVKISKVMADESGIKHREISNILNTNGYLDGKTIKI